MKLTMVKLSILAGAASAMIVLGLGTAQAQQGNARKPRNTVIMVCHESGGSGLPLTDYVNNLDVAWLNVFNILETTLPNGTPPIYTETSATPTSCALATSILSQLGLSVTQSFSHFPGYYIEIFTN